jgi:hypothetical protein
MNMPFARLGLLMLMLAFLGGCSNSNNLPDPTSSGSGAIEASCNSATDGICVFGQFVADQAVAGLNYKCGNVVSLTDDSGTFSCPANSVATFYLAANNTNRQIILGSAVISPVLQGLLGSQSAITVGSLQISPADIAKVGPGPNGGGTFIGDLSANNTVLTITRFLKALDDDGLTWKDPAYSGFNGSNRILISDNTRSGLAGLSSDIPAKDFTGDDLTPAMQAFVASIPGKSLADIPPMDLSSNHLAAFFNRSSAGVYFASGLNCLYTNLSLVGASMCNLNGTASAPKSGELIMFVDRTGYGYGFGVTSTSSQVSLNPAEYYIDGGAVGAPSPTAPLNRPVNYNTGAFNLQAISQASGGVNMAWTGNMRQGAIASTQQYYDQLYDKSASDAIADGTLGRWTYGKNTDAFYVPAGQYTLLDIKPANPYLDTNAFDTVHFPVNVQLTFLATSTPDGSGTQVCPTSNPYCITAAAINVSILKNGDIITNSNDDCNSIGDPTASTPVDSAGNHETRIGFVSTVDTDPDSDTPVYRASLTLLFPKNNGNVDVAANIPANLRGVVLGIYSGALVHLPLTGPSSLTLTTADAAFWNNFLIQDDASKHPVDGVITAQPSAGGGGCPP